MVRPAAGTLKLGRSASTGASSLPLSATITDTFYNNCHGPYEVADFDGTPYWADWPTSTMPSRTFPGSFTQSLPTSGRGGYAQYMIQTDTALSESTCAGPAGTGCAIPPPNAPGAFYPFYATLGYPEFEGPAQSNNTCT